MGSYSAYIAGQYDSLRAHHNAEVDRLNAEIRGLKSALMKLRRIPAVQRSSAAIDIIRSAIKK